MGANTRPALRHWSWTSRPRGLVPYAACAIGATVAAGTLRVTSAADFERFLGPLPPVLTVATAGALGLVSLGFLERLDLLFPGA